jgi:hypothetical protein
MMEAVLLPKRMKLIAIRTGVFLKELHYIGVTLV